MGVDGITYVTYVTYIFAWAINGVDLLILAKGKNNMEACGLIY